MAGRLRHRVPAARHDWIHRHRLVDRLRRRFEVTVTVVVAPAGFGKTTALSQAVAATSTDPTRVDVWLRCEPADDDPGALAAAVLASVAASTDRPVPDEQGEIRSVADTLASLAPAHVCLVLDDVHVLERGDHLDELLRHLPANAHLALAGRALPPVDLIGHELDGQVDRITQDDLAFDDDEFDTFVGERRSTVDPAQRWPAMVALELGSGVVGPVDYLVKEVVAAIGSDRLPALTALAHLDEVDEAAALAATDGGADATELLADLPLVHHSDRGTFRLHDLWRESLTGADALDPDAAAALSRIAEERLDREPVEAAELFAAAGRGDGVERALKVAAGTPLVHASVAELRRLGDAATASIGDRPVTDLIAASVVHAGDEVRSAERFARAAARARDDGDETVEALALLHEFNMRWIIDPAAIPDPLVERATHLAQRGHRPAHVVTTMGRALRARLAGDPETAQRALAELTPPTTGWEVVYHAFGVIDLGRPELVHLPGDDAEVTSTAVGLGGQHVAQALWLQGAIAPEPALAYGSELAAVSDDHQVAHVSVSTNAVLAFVATAAGRPDRARQHADRALRQSTRTASVDARHYALVADAIVTVAERGEDAAAQRLDRLLDDLPIDGWPPRPYLNALSAVYALVPRTRPTLDQVRLGPAMSTAVAAGRALVALREGGDPAPAAALPWDDEVVLRVHVLPSHLAELAAAAAAAGDGRVGPVLDRLPDARPHLLAIGERHRHAPTAGWASARAQRLPARPADELRLDLLGPTTLRRGETVVLDPDWTGRARVRQLLAHLVHHRKVARRRVVDDLWPGMETAKALANLRVNLAHLQRVLQPERGRDEPPWFVRADDQSITVASDGLVVDVHRFEDTDRRARSLDQGGRSTEAIECYRAVVDLHRGEYLEDLPDAEWAEVERVRLGALALGARCRLGELLLSRGEPEESAWHATAALRGEPLPERAARLLTAALVAPGDRAAARRAMEGVLARLADHHLHPEHATVVSARRLGLDVHG
ncbi:MAG TPA: BTAD domain-containing putative transcriptional regulator [Acidimicrobiales bacterium]|nr:BTAD domain-containing putative transcriptional regulator [Acidimicrobiales bacterium]